MDLEKLLVREQIRAALARYVRGVDRLDLELALSAFHPGAVDHHGKNVGDPRETFPLVFERVAAHVAGSHVLGSSAMTFLDDGAVAVETYCVAYHRIRGADGLRDLNLGLRYVDRFEVREDEWRIIERHVIEDWRRVDPVTGDVPPSAFEAGRRDGEDRSYALGV